MTVRVALVALIAAVVPCLALAQSKPRSSLGPQVLHVPVEQKTIDQGVLTPVPVRVELPRSLPARRVLVHYKVHGAKEWRTLELRREGEYYVGAIPCLEVSTITGDLFYYIRIHDARGAVIGFSGTRSDPFVVGVHHESERPDLAKAPARCPDPADCPPGLPGCPSAEVERVPCLNDADCEGGLSCGWDGFCGEDPRRKNWLSVSIEQQVGLVSTSGACTTASQESEGYACYRKRDGAAYLGSPVYTNEPVRAGLAPTRVHLSFERLLFYDTSIGVRFGYAFRGGGPTPREGTLFLPYSGELHATHWFGDDPFSEQRLRPYALLGGGFAMFDIETEAHVREDPTRSNEQGGNDLEQTLTVWKRAGDGYVVLGAGALYPLSEGFGISAELRFHQVFPFGATVLGADTGVRFGF